MTRRLGTALGIAVLSSVAAACSRGATSAKAAPGPQEAPAAARASAPAQASGERTDAAPRLCEHGVPADLCTRCNPELIEVFKEQGDWCDEHGVPKSLCLKCTPSLTFAAATQAQPAADWCEEHAAPESMCTKCRPQLIAKFIAAGDYCREHGYPESVCPYCHPERVKAAGHALPVFPKPGTLVRLASAEVEREAGIETKRAEVRPFARSIEVSGRLEFDPTRLARLSARGEAVIAEVKVDVGDDVRRGQPLVVLRSGAIGGAQSRLAAADARLGGARGALAREEQLLASGISSRRDVEQARTEAAAAQAERDAARWELEAAGVGERGAGGRYTVVAPFDGTVIAREASPGRAVASEDVLVEVADVRKLWAVLDIPEERARDVREGQRVEVRMEGSDEARPGRIARVAASVDPQTRTVRARVEISNEDRSLKAGAFLRARIDLAERRAALLVPRGAIQRAEGHDLVFVRTAAGVYQPVPVEVGGDARGEVEVLRGLAPGAEVVTTGAFVLKTEILKDSIGAGCVDD